MIFTYESIALSQKLSQRATMLESAYVGLKHSQICTNWLKDHSTCMHCICWESKVKFSDDHSVDQRKTADLETGPWLRRKPSMRCDLFQHQMKTCGIEPLKTVYEHRKHQELNQLLYNFIWITIWKSSTSSTVSVQIFMTPWSFQLQNRLELWMNRGDANTWYPSASVDSTYDNQKS